MELAYYRRAEIKSSLHGDQADRSNDRSRPSSNRGNFNQGRGCSILLSGWPPTTRLSGSRREGSGAFATSSRSTGVRTVGEPSKIDNASGRERINGQANRALRRGRRRSVEKSFQLSAANRMLQLSHRLGFDLPNSLACHLKDSAHFFEGVSVSIT